MHRKKRFITCYVMKLITAISVSLLLACVCIFAAITAVLEAYSFRQEREQTLRLTRMLQVELARRIDAELAVTEVNATRSAKGIEALGQHLNESTAGEVLRMMLESDTLIAGGSLAFVPGHGIASSGADSRYGIHRMLYLRRYTDSIATLYPCASGYDYTSMQWFTIPVSQGKAQWSAPYFDEGAGDCLMTTYSIPCRDDLDSIMCVVTADVRLSSLDMALEKLRPYPHSVSFLTGNDGSLITGTDSTAIGGITIDSNLLDKITAALGNDGVANTRISIDGEDYLLSALPLSDMDATVCTLTPYDDVSESLATLRTPIFLVITVGFVMLLTGIVSVMRRAGRPLSRLTRAAREIGDGNLDLTIPATGKYTDINKLRDAMEYMQHRIRRFIAEAEQNAREKARIQSELDIAAGIQAAMLPMESVRVTACRHLSPEIDIAATIIPAREVSGDMYDFVVSGDRLYFIIADVSGKGVPASLVMASVHSLFRYAVADNLSPDCILSKINRVMADGNDSCMFVTAIAGMYDMAAGNMTLANAGHNPPALCDSSGCRMLDLPPALPIGVMADVCYTGSTFTFGAGSTLLLYTDGLTETEDSTCTQYGTERLLAALSAACSHHGSTADGIVTAMLHSAGSFSGQAPADDLTLICITDRRKESMHLNLRYDIAEIARLQQSIARFGERHGLDDALVWKMTLIAEEAVTNIITHSQHSAEATEITFMARYCDDGIIAMELCDSGVEFNPLLHDTDAIASMSAEQRQPGGLGILMIKKLADTLVYKRVAGQNIMKITIK